MTHEPVHHPSPFAGADAEELSPGVVLVAACLERLFVTFIWDFNRDLRFVLRLEAAGEGKDMRWRGMVDGLFDFVFRTPDADGSAWHVAYNDGFVQHWSNDWVLVGTSRWKDIDELSVEARDAQRRRLGRPSRQDSDVAFQVTAANGQLVTVKTDGTVERRLPGAPTSKPFDIDRIEQPAGVNWIREEWNAHCEAAEWWTCNEMPWPRLGVSLLNAPPPWVTSAHAETLADELFQRRLYPAVGTAAVYIRPADPAFSARVSGRGVEAASWLLPAVVVWRELGPAQLNDAGEQRIPTEGFATQAAVVRNVLFIGGVERTYPLGSVEISDVEYSSPEGFTGVTLRPNESSSGDGDSLHLWVADRHGGRAVLDMLEMLKALADNGVESSTWFHDWRDLWRAATAPHDTE